ncbi:MAG: CAP domain-containing protein [Deltaproteobacteria bacterium]|nr:CAP domain-containing protein [Deltaproteobacteria bacterium]MDH3382481.1 CAP domain-containing protein [Deltaproteobacteria bacterium]
MQAPKIRRKRVSSFLFAVVLSFLCGCGGGDSGTVSPSSPPPENPGPGTGIPGIDSIRQEFLDAVNQARSVDRMCGASSYPAASAVAWSDVLAMAAYLHSEDMATNNFFSHTGSDGSTPGERITREGYDWWRYGENIAVGYPTVSAVMQAWLDSEGHCRNIMNSAFAEIGAAFVEGQYLGNPAAPYWTFDLATHQ